MPARFRDVSGLQCFDLDTFLGMVGGRHMFFGRAGPGDREHISGQSNKGKSAGEEGIWEVG